MQHRFSAVIPAAGYSSRMGRFKPMLPLGETTIIERVIKLFQGCGVEEILVVVGFQRDCMHPVLERSGVKEIISHRYREGMFSSVVAGLTASSPGTEATFILPVDIPVVAASTISRLMDTHHRSPGKILRPVYAGLRGHPPLIPRIFAESIAAWDGEGGLRAALAQWESETIQVEVPDENILFDVDTPDDYEQLLVKWRRLNSTHSAGVA